MRYTKLNLPAELSRYLEEISADKALKDAFKQCDIDIYSPEQINECIENENWRDSLMPGEANYEIKPFAESADGGVWVVLNDRLIGRIGTEGECGIIARNADEFMNIIAVCKVPELSSFALKDITSFCETVAEANAEFDVHEIFESFTQRHGFETEYARIYEMLKLGLTVRPFFEVKAVDEDYCDSYSLLGLDDGQESLEAFIANCMP